MKRLIAVCITSISLCSAYAVSWNDTMSDTFQIWGNLWVQDAIMQGNPNTNQFVQNSILDFTTNFSTNNPDYARITFYSNVDTGTTSIKLGSIHGNADDGFGFLNNNNLWALRVDRDTKNTRFFGDLIFESPNEDFPKKISFGTYGISVRFELEQSGTISLNNKYDTVMGKLVANGNGSNFGLMNKDSNWIFREVYNNETYMAINGAIILSAVKNGESGDVGIGTRAPQAKLHVNGDGIFNGSVSVEPGGDLSMGTFTQHP